MKSKQHVKQISVSNESPDYVLFEGVLGDLEELSIVEGAILEVKCTNGFLRIDLSEDELRNILFPNKEVK
jgi:hypothetical protein